MTSKLTHLKWFDVLILTALLFGQPLYQSTWLFLSQPAGQELAEQVLSSD